MTRLLEIIFFVFAVSFSFFANGLELIKINDQTPVIFSGDFDTTLVLVDPDGAIDINDLLQREEMLVPAHNISKFETNNHYWVHHKIKNELELSKIISINGLWWNKVKVFVFSETGERRLEKEFGQVGPYNIIAGLNPRESILDITSSQFPLFEILPGETVSVFLNLKSHPTWSETNIFLPFSDAILESEGRRLSIFIEGSFIGILFALLCFAFFNAIKTNDRTNYSYCAWLFFAFMVSICGWSVDGARFFEFFVNISGVNVNNHESLYMTVSNITGYSQAIAYVIFARNFLELKNHFPLFFKITNLYIGWYVLHFLFCLSFDHALSYKLVVYPLLLSTLFVLIGIYWTAFQRYRQGMKIAMYFMVAAIPYFLFRAIFLLSLVGIPSPFSLLPDRGLGLFLQNGVAAMTFGICLEAIIMSLAVVGRMQYLQNELKERAEERSQFISQQNKGLEVIVAERTEELKTQNEGIKRQKDKLERISHQLSKYLPPQIHKSLIEGKYDSGITTRRKKLTIFFSDIKNFTSTTGGLQPEDLTKYLNEYFSEMAAIAQKYGATIDKYIGDAMMVFFGDPESKGERQDARACVEMSLEMQERIQVLQRKWRGEGFANPFEVRMGINTGYCNVGNFGSEQRLTYTIIGGEVNVAQRLEVAAKPNGILLSYETYAHAEDIIEVEVEDSIEMKGINREIKVYSVIRRRREKSRVVEVDNAEKSDVALKTLDPVDKAQEDVSTVKELMSLVVELKRKVEEQEKDIKQLKDA